jgi:hypothetical protein
MGCGKSVSGCGEASSGTPSVWTTGLGSGAGTVDCVGCGRDSGAGCAAKLGAGFGLGLGAGTGEGDGGLPIVVGTGVGGWLGVAVGVGLGLGWFSALMIAVTTCLGSIFGAGLVGASAGGKPLVVCVWAAAAVPVSRAAAPISRKLACRIAFAPKFPRSHPIMCVRQHNPCPNPAERLSRGHE